MTLGVESAAANEDNRSLATQVQALTPRLDGQSSKLVAQSVLVEDLRKKLDSGMCKCVKEDKGYRYISLIQNSNLRSRDKGSE